MRVVICDECEGRINSDDRELTLEGSNETPQPPYEVSLSVRTLQGSTKTSLDLCWSCFDWMRLQAIDKEKPSVE